MALRRHRLTFDQVANAVRRSSLDLPGGSVRTERGEILLRTVGQAYRGADYENLVLWTRSDGSRLLLGDVAAVVDGFAGNRPAGALRRAAGRDGVRLPLGRAERARRRGRRSRLRPARGRLVARRHHADDLAGPVAGADRPAGDHVQQRRRRLPARLRRADALSRHAPRLLGQPGDPDRLSSAPSRSCRGWA